MLEVMNLHRSFGPRQVLRGVSLTARDGELVVLFGSNGAGKSTFLKICATLLRPGRYPNLPRIEVDGFNLFQEAREARARLGYLGHHAGAYPELTGRENLLFAARLHGLEEPQGRVAAMLELVGLTARAEEPTLVFSHGMLQRLALARTLLHNPTTLLLDEPFQGLDPRASGLLTGMMLDARAEGRAVVVATHDVELGLRLADKVLVLVEGRFKLLGLKGQVTSEQVTAALQGGRAS